MYTNNFREGYTSKRRKRTEEAVALEWTPTKRQMAK